MCKVIQVRITKDERPLKSLDRVFSKAGVASRSEARSWISDGRVRVNGKSIRNPDHWVDLERDRVTLDNKPLRQAGKRYILLYKPKGYLTTHRDTEGRPTVYDLVSGAGVWLAPVGRLDLDTSGLLLMTNDTGFADRIADPERKVPKIYQVKAATLLSDGQLERLRQEFGSATGRPGQPGCGACATAEGTLTWS